MGLDSWAQAHNAVQDITQIRHFTDYSIFSISVLVGHNGPLISEATTTQDTQGHTHIVSPHFVLLE